MCLIERLYLDLDDLDKRIIVKPCLDQPYASYITKATVALRVQKGSVGTFEWQRSIGFDPGRFGVRGWWRSPLCLSLWR